MTYILHTTIAGERWDLLSWQYYGSPFLYGGIIMANPAVPIEPVFEAGIVIAIPIIQAAPVAPNNLPPWGTL